MTERLLTESTGLGEATVTADAASGVLEVEFITPGWGSSGYYSREVVEAAAPLFAVGTHMYLDHPTEAEEHERPERSVRDLAAVITEAGAVSSETGGIRGRVQVAGPYRTLLTDEAIVSSIGLSIRGSATDVSIGEAEGRTGRIIEGLAAIDSVDFVTHAGRGGRVLAVLESARSHRIAEATANETREQLQQELRDTFGGEQSWVWVRDFDETTVWYEHETPDAAGTFGIAYQVDADGAVTLSGTPVEVRAQTQYVPVNPAGQSTTTEESEEDTMPQIEEARLRELEEASGRVPTLEAERDAARQERDEARRERDTLRAREAATSRARARVTQANADLAPATVERIVAEATRSVPLTEAGGLDEAAFDTAVDAARTAEETYLAGLAEASGAGRVRGFGGTQGGEQSTVTESDIDSAVGSAFGHKEA